MTSLDGLIAWLYEHVPTSGHRLVEFTFIGGHQAWFPMERHMLPSPGANVINTRGWIIDLTKVTGMRT